MKNVLQVQLNAFRSRCLEGGHIFNFFFLNLLVVSEHRGKESVPVKEEIKTEITYKLGVYDFSPSSSQKPGLGTHQCSSTLRGRGDWAMKMVPSGINIIT